MQKAIVNLLASQGKEAGQKCRSCCQPGEASDPNPASSVDGGKVAASWMGSKLTGCDNCGYGQKRKWHGSWEEESKSKRQELQQGEQEAKQEVANFEKKEVAIFEKKEVANFEKKESQQLVNYLLSQGEERAGGQRGSQQLRKDAGPGNRRKDVSRCCAVGS